MAFAAVDRAPLLPASLEERLKAWLCTALGYLVLLACLAGGLSLLTWSVVDPSLTHATGGFTRNALGPLGAILSDVLMQMLGLAGVLALLPPVFWGLQLVASGRLEAVRPKMVMAPFAVVLLAAALSALPTATAWPLHHGFGGLLGDMALALLAQFLAVINPERAHAAAGLFYCAAGLLVMLASLGLSRRDLRLICRPLPAATIPGATARGFARAWRLGSDIISARREPMLVAPERREPVFGHEPPRLEFPETPRPTPVLDPAPVVPEPYFDAPLPPELYDDVTDGSRAIAARFAPGGGASAHTVQDIGEPLLAPITPARAPAVRSDAIGVYRPPPLAMLRPPAVQRAEIASSQRVLRDQAQLLVSVLQDFGVKGEVKNIHPGPVVTLFEFEPARGIKASRIIGLADDLARSMSAASARVAVIPGRNAIGIELPNLRRETVYLRELLEADAFRTSKAALPLALGKGIDGAPAFADLARMPHLLVAGTTGSGKSVGINAMILSLLLRHSPDQCRFLMIDPKMLELSVYNGIPHLLSPVVTDPQKAIAALNWAVREMEDRYQRMSKLGVRNIEAYNARVHDAARRGGLTSRFAGEVEFTPLPYIVVVVDEFADLMIVAGKEIESAVQRLAQMARAAGIHLIMATQRPSVDIITGTIKANFPMRISFKVASRFDSRTIINEQGAEQLLGEGDMLFAGGSGRVLRVHGPFVSDDEVEGIVRFLSSQGEPRYIQGITDLPEPENALEAQRASSDDLYERALAIVLRDQKASISYLQRRLSIGYNRAAGLIERLEQEGIIGPPSYKGGRPVLAGGPAHDL
jgi:S-DNA-T family DNA segregation ATPase FtsK/SpoIIIE